MRPGNSREFNVKLEVGIIALARIGHRKTMVVDLVIAHNFKGTYGNLEI